MLRIWGSMYAKSIGEITQLGEERGQWLRKGIQAEFTSSLGLTQY